MPQKRRPPKDLHKYLSSRLAAARLIYLAIDHILLVKKGIRVKWNLSIHYWSDPEIVDESKSQVRIMHSSYSSGDADPEGELATDEQPAKKGAGQ